MPSSQAQQLVLAARRPSYWAMCRVARIWGKEIVSDKWLQASAAAGHCKETALYDLEPGLYAKRPQPRSAHTSDIAICN